MIPGNYDEWRHCIEHYCQIPLTPEFLAQRLRELDDPRVYSTEQLLRCYGHAHVEAVRGWFRQAARETGAGMT